MKQSFVFFLVLSSILAGLCASGCNKDQTILEGKVIDAKTGEGLDSVSIRYFIKDQDDDEGLTEEEQRASTDVHGDFHIKIPNGKSAYSFIVLRYNYLSQVIKPSPVRTGQTKYIEIQLFPENSWLNLILHNGPTLLGDTLFIHLFNRTIYPNGYEPTPNSPTLLDINEQKTEIFKYSSGTYTEIRWGFSLNQYLQNPMVDSIYMNDQDTTNFTVDF